MKKLMSLAWLGFLILSLIPIRAHAQGCNYLNYFIVPGGYQTYTDTFNVPSSLDTSKIPNGSVITTITGIPGTSFTGNAIIGCRSSSIGAGYIDRANGMMSGNFYPFPGITNLRYRLLYNGATGPLVPYPSLTLQLSPYSQIPGLMITPMFGGVSSGNTPTIQLQLIKAGPIPAGSVMQPGLLGTYRDGDFTSANFNLSSSTTIIDTPPGGCTVSTKSISVILPAQSIGVQGGIGGNAGIGSTAGRTPFTIVLTCTPGATASIQLDYGGTYTGIPGVLSNKGTAPGVDVQLLDKNANPVNFGTRTVVGATPTGTLNIGYFAQYYKVGVIAPGTVSASATFTMTYQ
jgi:type 1 fimbria pilin